MYTNCKVLPNHAMSTFTFNELKLRCHAQRAIGDSAEQNQNENRKRRWYLALNRASIEWWQIIDWQEEKNSRTKCLELPIDSMTCVNQDPLLKTIWSVLQRKVEAPTRHWPPRSLALTNQKLQCGLRKCCGDWPAERKSITWVRVQSF